MSYNISILFEISIFTANNEVLRCLLDFRKSFDDYVKQSSSARPYIVQEQVKEISDVSGTATTIRVVSSQHIKFLFWRASYYFLLCLIDKVPISQLNNSYTMPVNLRNGLLSMAKKPTEHDASLFNTLLNGVVDIETLANNNNASLKQHKPGLLEACADKIAESRSSVFVTFFSSRFSV